VGKHILNYFVILLYCSCKNYQNLSV